MTGKLRSAVCGVLVSVLFVGNAAVALAQETSKVPCYSYDESCKSIIKKTAIVGGALIGALIIWKVIRGSNKRAKSNAPPDAMRIFYTPSTGTAMLHMVMNAVSNDCPGDWSSHSASVVSGKLPPGLKLEPNNRITGTPLGSGTWQADIGFAGVQCNARNGKTKQYGERIVKVTIKID